VTPSFRAVRALVASNLPAVHEIRTDAA